MVLDESQVVEIKKQLFEQIKSFPEEKRVQAEAQINAMDASQLEEFLKANNMVKDEGDTSSCPFCSIVSGKIPATKIGENDFAIAVLELNPISKGHSLIIPKDHSCSAEDAANNLKELVKEIIEKINSKFSPKDILVKSVNLFGHEVINLLPVYNGETMDSPKKQATPEELAALKNELDSVIIVEEPKVEEIKKEESEIKEISEKDMWLPVRIP